MFVIDNLQKIFDTEFVVLLIYHSKLHMSSSNGLCDIAIKPKAKYRFHIATTNLLFHGGGAPPPPAGGGVFKKFE
jgi:hypothetical protein